MTPVIDIESKIALGIVLDGFFTSSATFAISSNPTKAKKIRTKAIIITRPAASTMVKIIFVQEDSLIPKKLIKDNAPNNKIALITIGRSINSAKYPPKPNATTAAVIIDVMAVSHPMINPKKLLLKEFFIKVYSAAAFGKTEESSA